MIQTYSKGEDHGDLDNTSYRKYMRDMCEDLKGSYFVIMGIWLREQWIYNYEMLILFPKISCRKESALFPFH